MTNLLLLAYVMLGQTWGWLLEQVTTTTMQQCARRQRVACRGEVELWVDGVCWMFWGALASFLTVRTYYMHRGGHDSWPGC